MGGVLPWLDDASLEMIGLGFELKNRFKFDITKTVIRVLATFSGVCFISVH